MINGKFKEILDFLNEYHDSYYRAPEKALTKEEAEKMLVLRDRAIKANSLFNEILAANGGAYRLLDIKNRSWRDGSNIKIRNYFWGQLKYATNYNDPQSVSLFAEMSPKSKNARFRISLEIDEKNANNEDFDVHMRLFDISIPKDSGLVYLVNDHMAKNLIISKSSPMEIKKELAEGKYQKVQIAYIIDRDDKLTDKQYVQRIDYGIRSILPFYNHILGMDEIKNY